MKILLGVGIVVTVISAICEILLRWEIIKIENKSVIHALVVIGIIAIIIPEVSGWIELSKKRLDIYPKKLDFVEGKWANVSQFTVRNNQDIPLYQIWIKMSCLEGIMDITKMKFRLNGEAAKTVLDFKNSQLNYKTIGLFAEDKKGRKNIYLILDKLLPGEDRVFDVKYDAGEKPIQSKSCIQLMPIHFENKPSQVLQQKNKVAVQVKPPEQMNVLGAFVFN